MADVLGRYCEERNEMKKRENKRRRKRRKADDFRK